MKKKRYEVPQMAVVKMQPTRFLADSSDYRLLPKEDGEAEEDGISDLDDLL